MSSLESAAWPTFRLWVGDSVAHPLRELLDAADAGSVQAAAVCAAWDDLLVQVEQAAPNRWQGKRKEFRQQTSYSETLSERSELLLAAGLVRAGVQFEFGRPGQPQPDLVLEAGLGIEVGSRCVDGAQQLAEEIQTVVDLGDESEHIQITFDVRPLAIREKLRREIVALVRSGQEVDVEVLPVRGDQPAARVRITRTPSSGPSVVETSIDNALLTPHLQDVEAEIKSKIIKDRRKVAQATSMPTVIVIDLARCGLAWLRPLRIWEQVLRGMLDEDDPYVAIAVMVTDLDSNGVQLAWAANPHADSERAKQVSRLFAQLSEAG